MSSLDDFVTDWFADPDADQLATDMRVGEAERALLEQEVIRHGVSDDVLIAELESIRARAQKVSDLAHADMLATAGDLKAARAAWTRIASSGHPVYSSQAATRLAASAPQAAQVPLGRKVLPLIVSDSVPKLVSAVPYLLVALAWPLGLPWPAVFALALAGLLISAGLAWQRLQLNRVVEHNRHREVMTVIAHDKADIDAVSVIALSRVSAGADARRLANWNQRLDEQVQSASRGTS